MVVVTPGGVDCLGGRTQLSQSSPLYREDQPAGAWAGAGPARAEQTNTFWAATGPLYSTGGTRPGTSQH